MGYKTPNIDSIAKEGALFTDWYGQQSCTAGRACFITGQSGFRTGMLKVGLPGAKEGLQARDVTIAELLKAQGYMTAQFGKNHLGDADETLPTAHGFDEFFGSLYHLNAEEEFENEDYFKDPAMIKKYQTRGVLHCWANPDGTQKIESTGPLGKKRMETIDDEVTEAALDYLEKAKKADKPFFMWWNSTRMHIYTHLKKESQGKTGLGVYPDGMVEHDGHVGQILDKLKELGLDDNTIVMYSTDNGAEVFTLARRRHDAVPRREERELGGRLSRAVRDPLARRHQARHHQQRPLLARGHAADAAGGRRRAGRQGAVAEGHEGRQEDLQSPSRRLQHHRYGSPVRATNPRKEFFYWNDDGSLVGLRYDNWKVVFQEQRSAWLRRLAGSVHAAALAEDHQPAFRSVRAAEQSASDYAKWRIDRTYLLVPAQQFVAQYIGTFKEFPPSQKVGSFSLDQVLEKLTAASTSGSLTCRERRQSMRLPARTSG